MAFANWLWLMHLCKMIINERNGQWMVYTGKSRVYKVFALGIMIINVCLFYEQQLYGMAGSSRWTHPLCVCVCYLCIYKIEQLQRPIQANTTGALQPTRFLLWPKRTMAITAAHWLWHFIYFMDRFFFVPVVGLWWKHNAHLTKLFKCLLCSCWTNQIRKSGECLMVQLLFLLLRNP